jgi:hypothetical protein
VSNPPTDGETYPAATPSPDAAMTAAPVPQAPAPELEQSSLVPDPAPAPATAAPEPVTLAPVPVVGMSPSAPPAWPVSEAPYGVVPAPAPAAAAPPQRGRASLVILSVLSTVLLLAIGVLTVLYINDRQTIGQQRTLIDQNATDLKAKAVELDNTKKDLDSTKKDLDSEKACADTIRDFFKQIQSMLSTFNPQTGVDPESPAFQAIGASSQALIQKCGIQLG